MDHLCIIMDESGSMSSMASVVYEGAREIATGLLESGTCCVVHFNTEVTIDEEVSKEQAVSNLSARSCHGGTALYDAICDGIERTVAAHIQDSSVVVAIVTDGLENSSSRNTVADVRRAVELANSMGWRVTFLGSNQDAILTASGLGIAAERALTYGSNESGARSAFRSLSAANGRYARGDTEGFTVLERQQSMVGGERAQQAVPPPSRPRSASVGGRRASMNPVRWVSLDPRTGDVVPYSEALSARLEAAKASGASRMDCSPDLSATVILQTSGNHIQRTTNGERDVRRLTSPSTTLHKADLVDIHGAHVFRIVKPNHPLAVQVSA